MSQAVKTTKAIKDLNESLRHLINWIKTSGPWISDIDALVDKLDETFTDLKKEKPVEVVVRVDELLSRPDPEDEDRRPQIGRCDISEVKEFGEQVVKLYQSLLIFFNQLGNKAHSTGDSTGHHFIEEIVRQFERMIDLNPIAQAASVIKEANGEADSEEDHNDMVQKQRASHMLLRVAHRCQEKWKPAELSSSDHGSRNTSSGGTGFGSVFVDAFNAFTDYWGREFTGQRQSGLYYNGKTGEFDYVA